MIQVGSGYGEKINRSDRIRILIPTIYNVSDPDPQLYLSQNNIYSINFKLNLFPINPISDYSYFILQIVIPDSALGLLQLRPHAAHQLHHVRILTKRNEEAEQTVLNLWGSAKMVFRGGIRFATPDSTKLDIHNPALLASAC